MTNRIQMGIDAGGSKIEAAGLLDDVSFLSSFPSVNARVAPLSETVLRICSAIDRVVTSLLDQAKLPRPAAIDICLGIAGAASPRVQDALREGIAKQSGIPSTNILVVSDARIAFEAAFLEETEPNPGRMLVICGTGSGCYSFDSGGQLIRTGGWGPTIGDPGSGVELGKLLLRQALADVERGTTSPFTAFLDRGLRDVVPDQRTESATLSVPGLLDIVYGTGFNVASLAPTLLSLARENDRARRLLEEECASLSKQIVRLASTLKTKSPTVSLTGGLNANSLYSRLLTEAIVSRLPQANVRVSEHKPVQGALYLAARLDC